MLPCSMLALIPRMAKAAAPSSARIDVGILFVEWMAVTTMRLASRSASIASLFVTCRPLAVLARVRAVVVDALNRVSRLRPESHVGEKLRERYAPLRRDNNATTAVVFEPTRRRNVATGLDVLPDSKLHRRRQTMSPTSLGRDFAEQATTAPYLFIREVTDLNTRFTAAFAQAMHPSVSVLAEDVFYDQPSVLIAWLEVMFDGSHYQRLYPGPLAV